MRKPLMVALFLVSVTACGGGGDDDDDDNDVATADASGTPPTAYLITQMTLADPHTFAVGLLDVTGTVNQLISDSINMDATMPPDGLLDFSVVPIFRPLDQGAGASTPLEIVFADCTAPINSTTCSRGADSTVVPATATNDDCLTPIAGTTGNYSPAVVVPSAPCFGSNAVTFDVALGDIVLHLEDARISATYSGGDPATSLTNGLILGFLSEQQADMTILPEDIAVVGGEALSTLLQDSDKDDNNGTSGWWFYLNFTATPVTYTD